MITFKHLTFTFRLFVIIALSSGVSSTPVPKTTFDQSQQGELNVRADLDNILILFIPSGGIRLVDNPQIGSLLQIFSNARKNLPVDTSASPVMTSGVSDSPYKVEIAQSAIDKLQSDVEDYNTVIPITKMYNIEKKEINDQPPLVNIDDNKPTIILQLADKKMDADTKYETQTSQEILVNFNVTDKVSNKTEQEVVTTTTKPTSTQEVTTFESVVTSQPVIPQKVTAPSKDEEKDTSKGPPNKPQVVNKQDRVQQSHKQQTIRQASRPSFIIPTPSKSQATESAERQQLLRVLRFGLTHCAPHQRMTDVGECVDIEPNDRQSRTDETAELVERLNFGLRPADRSE